MSTCQYLGSLGLDFDSFRNIEFSTLQLLFNFIARRDTCSMTDDEGKGR